MSILALLFRAAVPLLAWLAAAAPTAAPAAPSDPPALGLTVRDARPHGVTVDHVARGSAGEALGVHPGDVVVGVNRRLVRDAASYRALLAEAPRARTSLQLARGGTVAEAFLAATPAERDRLAAAVHGPRQCVTLCLRAATGSWVECGCAVVPARVCNGCRTSR